jgi:hypothetical protein
MGSHLPISMKTANAKLNGQRRGTKQDKLKATCTKCNKKGHYAPKCPNNTANAATQQSSGESRETGTAPTVPPDSLQPPYCSPESNVENSTAADM